MKLSDLSTVTMFVGLPGQGKTTIAAALVKMLKRRKYNKLDFPVYSNVPIVGAFEYDWFDHFGKYDMHGLILLDEAGLCVDNRSWDRNFDKSRLQFLKLLRHYNNSKFVVFSQTWNDCDIKIRSMVGKLYIVKKSIIPGFSCAIPVFRKIDVNEDTKEFTEIYYKDHFFLRLFSTRFFFRPLYYSMFDSWDAPTLPHYDFSRYGDK